MLHKPIVNQPQMKVFDDKEQRLKIEHETLLEEYKSLREQIIEMDGFSRQVQNIALIVVGALIAGTGVIVDKKLQIVFLIFPLFLYTLAWAQVRFVWTVFGMSNYIKTMLAPRIKSILAELSNENSHNFELVFRWETHWKGIVRSYGLIALPVAGSHYGTTLLAAILSVGAYFLLSDPNTGTSPFVVVLLLLLNASAFIYSVVIGFKVEFGR
jgi:F0F1-type ATP synthase assembly protein I